MSKMLNIYRCPFCRYKLDISTFKKTRIFCKSCKCEFPINSGIPILWSKELKSELESIDYLLEMKEPEFKNLLNENPEKAVRVSNIIHHERISPFYDQDDSTASFLANITNSQKRIISTIENLPLSNGSIHLDIGCGTGNVMITARRLGLRTLGVDVSQSMLLKARNKDLEVILGDTTNLPIEDSQIDLVTMFSVLHHIYDTKKALGEVYRILKPNGFIYTDWDFHLPARKMKSLYQNSFIYQLVKSLLKKDRPLSKIQKLIRSDPYLFQIAAAAEYHHLTILGFTRESISRILKALGFRKILAISHSDPPALNQRWKRKLFMKKLLFMLLLLSGGRLKWPKDTDLDDHFLILAKK